MDRLATHLERLYGPIPEDPVEPIRSMVLELAGTAAWERLAEVWRGVQAELELPAPAIAVSGTDAFQLWFSLAVPVSPVAAQGFLDGLVRRWLADTPPARLRRHVAASRPRVPSQQAATGNWSAFVAPDLAPVFTDTPWLDIPPSVDGQADLLAGLRTAAPDVWAAAQARLAFSPEPAAVAPSIAVGAVTDPRQFLLQVMNDPSAPLALRIDAAKALLPHVRGDGAG